MKRKALVVLLLSLPLIPWLVQSGEFYYSINSSYSDLAVSHLPNAIFLIQSIKATGEIPLWSNLILGGAPFAADPLAGIWYVPGWLAYFLPQPFGFNLVLLLHLLWGGFGMVCLLSGLELRREAALFGGIAVELVPKVFAHAVAGHVTLVYAFAWFPWLILAEKNRQERPVSHRWWMFFPGLILGLVFLADPRGAAYGGVIWFTYSIWHAFEINNEKTGFKHLGKRLAGLVVQITAAFGVCAVLLLPMAEFIRLSTRSLMTASDVLVFSLPPAQLIGLIFPNIGGYAEYLIYPGSIVLLFFVLAVALKQIRTRVGYWLILAGIGIVIALGAIWPGASQLAKLPLVSLLRVPGRGWLLTGLSLVVIAAYAMDAMIDGIRIPLKNKIKLVIASISTISILLPLAVLVIGGSVPIGFFWAAGAFLTAMILVFRLMRPVANQSRIIALVIALIVADLSGVNLLGTNFRPTQEVMQEGAGAANYLSSQPGEFRVFSPSYSIPQQTAAEYNLELADGVNPMVLRSTAEFVAQASGVPLTGYSVTTPAFETGEPKTDNVAAIPNTNMLGLFNVKYFVSDFDQSNSKLSKVWQSGATRIYENLDVNPRIWVQQSDSLPGENIRSIGEISSDTPNYLSAKVSGPGLLVLSEVDYPGRILKIDGKTVNKLRIANIFIGTEIATGNHQVELSFKSTPLNIGLGISILTWILVLFISGFTLIKERKEKDNGSS